MLEILKAIFLGIVEGITEWLPISSTGHMILLVRVHTVGNFRRVYGNVSGSYTVRSNSSGSIVIFS